MLHLIWILATLPFRILGWIFGTKSTAPPSNETVPPSNEEDPEDDLEDFLDFMEEYEYFEGED